MDPEIDVDVPADQPELPVSPEAEGEAATPPAEAGEEETSQAEETTDDEVPEGPAKGGSTPYEKLLAKYGGDKDKMAAGVWEQMNSTARTHEELAEMRAILDEIRTSKVQEASVDQAISEDPSVKEIQTDLASISAEAKVARDRQSELNVNYKKAEIEMARLQGELKRADESEQYSLQREIERKEREMERILSENDRIVSKYETLQRNFKDAQRSLTKAQADARARVEREKADAIRTQQDAKLARREFNEALRAEAQRYGIDPDSKSYNFLSATFRTQIRDHIQALHAKGVTEGIDIEGAVKFLMNEYAEAVSLKPKFAKISAAKAEVSPKPPDAQAPTDGTRRTSTKGVKQDGAFWRERARKLMP